MDAKTLALIESTQAIPSMPQIVTRLREMMREGNYKQTELMRLLSVDTGLVADVLKLANSALFGVLREVKSLNQAVVLLGLQRISNLVIGRCMTEWVIRSGERLIDTRAYWQRSLLTGVLAAKLLDENHSAHRDDAFMCGLLADIGVIVLATAYSPAYGPAASTYLASSAETFLAEETRLVGITHPAIAGAVLDRWMFPIEFINVIEMHHTWPLDGISDEQRRIATAVNAASDLSWALCNSNSAAAIPACYAAAAKAGIGVDLAVDILNGAEADMSELAHVFRISGMPREYYQNLTGSLTRDAKPGCTPARGPLAQAGISVHATSGSIFAR